MWEKVIYNYETEQELAEKLMPLVVGKTVVLVADKETDQFILVGKEDCEMNNEQADLIVEVLNAKKNQKTEKKV